MALPVLAAVSAAASVLAAPQAAPAQAAETTPAQGSFGEFLSRSASEAARTLGDAETAAIDGAMGRASAPEVAARIMAAERTVQTAIALRDRFVSALQEISRLQI